MRQPSCQPPVIRHWHAEDFCTSGDVYIRDGTQISVSSFNHFGETNGFPFEDVQSTTEANTTICAVDITSKNPAAINNYNSTIAVWFYC